MTPYLLVAGVDKLLQFLKEAFDAEVLMRLARPDGSVMHAEARIGDSMVMMGEPMGKFGPMPAALYLNVEDCDAVYQRALRVGGVSVMEPTDMPHAGVRYGGVKDPCGNIWWPSTPIENVTPEEQAQRTEMQKDNWNERYGNKKTDS